MKNKLMIVLPLMGFMLAGCGDSAHPLVGGKFTYVKNQTPTETYQDGYTRESYFKLLNGVNTAYGSLEKVNTAVVNFFTEGFLTISDTFYESGYMAYSTADEITLRSIMVPNDSKGIDSENMKFMHSEGIASILGSGSSSSTGSKKTSFEIIADTFKKNGDKYEAAFISYYSPDSTQDTKITATLTYTFTK